MLSADKAAESCPSSWKMIMRTSKEGCELVVNKENETPLPLLIVAINTWYKRYLYLDNIL